MVSKKTQGRHLKGADTKYFNTKCGNNSQTRESSPFPTKFMILAFHFSASSLHLSTFFKTIRTVHGSKITGV